MKEWKGNKNALKSQLAIDKEYTTKGRDKDDFYATDPVAVRRLVEGASGWLREIFRSCRYFFSYIEKGAQYILYRNSREYEAPGIWECAVGSCNLFDELLRLGYDVIGTDIKDRCGREPKEMLNIDFLKTDISFTMEHSIGIILTNPPYSLATEFIKHALEILPDNGLYIAFMNISYLAGQKRFTEVYINGTLREIYIFSKRVECWRNNDKTRQTGSMANYAWYVFQKGYFGQPTLYWL